MTKKERILLPWECSFGAKSHMNLFGKIALAPLIVMFAVTISVCEALLTADD